MTFETVHKSDEATFHESDEATLPDQQKDKDKDKDNDKYIYKTHSRGALRDLWPLRH